MRNLLLFGALISIGCASSAAQGLPPLGPAATEPKPATVAAAAASTLSVDAANADLKVARAANLEKRYSDAEALMLKDANARPNMPFLWIELGQAQLGQKKYPEAEISFKAALSGGETVQTKAPDGGFYSAGKGTVAHVSVQTAAPPPDRKDSGEIKGAANSALGEVYIHLARVPEAKDAFDRAAAAFPSQAALYLRNETILFLQTGNAVEQVTAANKAIAADPTRAALYFYKGQGLAAQSTIDPKTQKLVMPAGCADALQKYLDLEPGGPYSADAKGMLAAAGIAVKAAKK
ncbi:MAG TPA: hypothetical protein VGG85_06290 [Terracidiphilus sp.]|jgi:tetratricopeptide (TPR) repeat protein